VGDPPRPVRPGVGVGSAAVGAVVEGVAGLVVPAVAVPAVGPLTPELVGALMTQRKRSRDIKFVRRYGSCHPESLPPDVEKLRNPFLGTCVFGEQQKTSLQCPKCPQPPAPCSCPSPLQWGGMGGLPPIICTFLLWRVARVVLLRCPGEPSRNWPHVWHCPLDKLFCVTGRGGQGEGGHGARPSLLPLLPAIHDVVCVCVCACVRACVCARARLFTPPVWGGLVFKSAQDALDTRAAFQAEVEARQVRAPIHHPPPHMGAERSCYFYSIARQGGRMCAQAPATMGSCVELPAQAGCACSMCRGAWCLGAVECVLGPMCSSQCRQL
jgi:hypothetical protein